MLKKGESDKKIMDKEKASSSSNRAGLSTSKSNQRNGKIDRKMCIVCSLLKFVIKGITRF